MEIMADELQVGMCAPVKVVGDDGIHTTFVNTSTGAQYIVDVEQIEGRSLLGIKTVGVLHRVRVSSYIYT